MWVYCLKKQYTIQSLAMIDLARSSPDFAAGIHADVWHAHALATAPLQVRSSGHAALDAELPGGGWPVGALIEVLQAPGVHQEWRLLLPALVGSGSACVVLVGAPYVPMAASLAARGLVPGRLLWVAAQDGSSRLWAAEQALRCADVDAVLLWLTATSAIRPDALRRLHMAAADFGKLLFAMRPAQARSEASPAPLRLALAPLPVRQDRPGTGLQVHLIKRRGPSLAQPLPLRGHDTRLADVLLASRHLPVEHHALDRTAPARRSAA